MGYDVIWEYQMTGNKWVQYTDDANKLLNSLHDDEYLANDEVSGIELGAGSESKWKLEFDLKEMRQKNVDSKFVRSIRCALKMAEDEPNVVWEYQGGLHGRWISFPPAVVTQLEDHHKQMAATSEDVDAKKLEFSLLGRDVSVDLSAKKATFLDSEAEVKVRRTDSNAAPPDTAKPIPTRRSPSRLRERTRSAANAEQEKKKSGGKKRGRKTAAEKAAAAAAEKESDEDEEGTVKRRKVIRERKKRSDENEIGGSTGGEMNQEEKDGKETAYASEENDENAGEESRQSSVESLSAELVLESEESETEESVPAPKGDAEVDIECRDLAEKADVYTDENGHEYSAMLNQTNIQFNNNKFFLIQLLRLKDETPPHFFVWFRWGRVGFRGQSKLTDCGHDLAKAIGMFQHKFRDKTHNDFQESHIEFTKVHGKYDLIRIDYTRTTTTISEDTSTAEKENSANGKEGGEKAEKHSNGGSKLDGRVQDLMRLLCDLKAMEAEAKRLDYDFNRIPLGKITKDQLKAGNEALTRIERHIKSGKFGIEFIEAVNAYYTRIPHAFGMRQPPPIKTIDQLKQEIELLDVLAGIQISVAAIAGDPLDKHYSRLKWELIPLDKDDEKYKLIEEYLQKTHGGTHNLYKMQIRNIFELQEKGGQDAMYVFRHEIDNRKLLWHGSKTTNFYSILAQGLRIAPPEAPSTGYMFGKGVYFSDISSKSVNYSIPTPGRPGLVLLSEVALGKTLDLKEADERMHKKLPKEKHSVCGVGKFQPDPAQSKTIDNGVEVPCGQPIEVENVESTLIYNEYIVYSLEQIRERFLVELDFDFAFQL